MNRIEKAKQMEKAHFPKVSFLQEDPEMQQIMKLHLFADVYGHGTLDFTMREYITLAVMAANNAEELITDHVKALLETGTPPQLILEVIYQIIPYAGLLKAHQALNYVHQALQELTNPEEPEIGSTVTEETRFQKGFDAQCSVFSQDAIQGGHDAAAIDLKHMQRYLSAHCFGDFYTRKGLDMRQRELLTFCTIASLGGCENQLRAHAKANLQAGNTRATLIEAITQCQPYIGFPRTLNAIQIIEEVSTTQ
ncbi:carboxymuconolactone decarboxylase family protein [Erysipelotrichaceae bacterium AF15-26LB]|nr:alkylhydroperoxidase AhpD family core domain protein [Erysipelotrichaceae bacterium 3_1_53]MCR0348521.1 carboxymuconolactone decarboxylase family protein [[Clostridium] innocuum]RJV88415.1 carboxymuconolactone decarboxylase family protein [Erysipelotrichaceae bacterium AF19-24AC]RJV90269.1 carboxymuconolactone decarboxylase family protein [Erysipelotrichaceae bacterium AF15-26LB]